MEMTPNKSELLGLLCADGSYRDKRYDYLGYNKNRGKYYKIKNKRCRTLEFTNKSISLIKHFKKLLKQEFDYHPKITKDSRDIFKITITKYDIMDYFIELTDFKHDNWKIPDTILNGEIHIKTSFIRGYFDGDGCVDFTKDNIPRIRISSVNYSGMKLISQILNSLDIKHNLNGPYVRKGRKPIYELLLKTCSVNDFIENIGSNHERKRNLFKKILNN